MNEDKVGKFLNGAILISVAGCCLTMMCVTASEKSERKKENNSKYVDMVAVDGEKYVYKNEKTGYYYYVCGNQWVYLGTEEDFAD